MKALVSGTETHTRVHLWRAPVTWEKRRLCGAEHRQCSVCLSPEPGIHGEFSCASECQSSESLCLLSTGGQKGSCVKMAIFSGSPLLFKDLCKAGLGQGVREAPGSGVGKQLLRAEAKSSWQSTSVSFWNHSTAWGSIPCHGDNQAAAVHRDLCWWPKKNRRKLLTERRQGTPQLAVSLVTNSWSSPDRDTKMPNNICDSFALANGLFWSGLTPSPSPKSNQKQTAAWVCNACTNAFSVLIHGDLQASAGLLSGWTKPTGSTPNSVQTPEHCSAIEINFRLLTVF